MLEAKPAGRTLSELIAAYAADRAGHWSPSTTAAYQPVFRLICGILGADCPLSTISRVESRSVFEAVKALPANLGKLKQLKGLSIPEAIVKAKTLSLPLLSPKSVNDSYMALAGSLFRWAVSEQWIVSSPFGRMTIDDPVDAQDKRDAFTMEQLQALFSAEPWCPRTEAPRSKPIRFWGPLLALYTGMRRGEIAQLGVADIVNQAGTWVVMIQPGDGRRLKTANARRKIPVHPELERMGFLSFVARQQTAGVSEIFPNSGPNNRGQWGDSFSDWFLRLLQKRTVTGVKLGMHSFRHNFQDRLREAGLHGDGIGQALVGRSGGGTSNDYGSGYSTAALKAAIDRIAYPELDLSHLYVDAA